MNSEKVIFFQQFKNGSGHVWVVRERGAAGYVLRKLPDDVLSIPAWRDFQEATTWLEEHHSGDHLTLAKASFEDIMSFIRTQSASVRKRVRLDLV